MSDGRESPDHTDVDPGASDSTKPSIRTRTTMDDGALQIMEDEFQTVLTELIGSDRSLDKFRGEYEKLYKALLKSHDSEQHLRRKCRDLNAELVTNSAKVQSAMKLSEEDKNAISSLRKDIEKAWKMVDVAHEKEQRAKETIQSLRIEINNLSKLIEQGTGKNRIVVTENIAHRMISSRSDC